MLASYASPRDAAWLAFREPTCLNVALKTIGHDIDAELLFANIVKVTHCLSPNGHPEENYMLAVFCVVPAAVYSF